MKKLLLLLLIGLFGLFCFVAGTSYQIRATRRIVKRVEVIKPAPFDQAILWSLIQSYRVDNNLTPFIKDQNLCAYANERLPEVAEKFNHTGFERTAQSKVATLGLSRVVENLVGLYPYTGNSIEVAAFYAWLNSPPHKKTIDDPANTHSCLRCDTINCVQLFGAY
mgnify:FL=1